MFRKVNKIHFVGIGGIGMSGIAELLKNKEFVVSGSDIADSPNVQRLIDLGINVSIGHKKENISREQASLLALAQMHSIFRDVKQSETKGVPSCQSPTRLQLVCRRRPFM